MLVTSVNPLRIYVYDEGLARFASKEYNLDFEDEENKYSHLTNYSVNKKQVKPSLSKENRDENDLKWTLTTLSGKLERIGISMDIFWSKIYEVIIKTFLSVDHHFSQAIK